MSLAFHQFDAGQQIPTEHLSVPSSLLGIRSVRGAWQGGQCALKSSGCGCRGRAAVMEASHRHYEAPKEKVTSA